MQNLESVVMAIATGAGCVAGMAAYLIVYEEYRRHFAEKRKAKHMALQTAFIALLFFVALGLLLAYMLPQAVWKSPGP